MEAYELDDLTNERRRSGERYLEFIRASTLSTGIYGAKLIGCQLDGADTEGAVV